MVARADRLKRGADACIVACPPPESQRRRAGNIPDFALRGQGQGRSVFAWRHFAAGQRRVHHGQHVVGWGKAQALFDMKAQVPQVHIGIACQATEPLQSFDSGNGAGFHQVQGMQLRHR